MDKYIWADSISLYRLFDLNSIIDIEYSVNFLKFNHLLKNSSQINQKEYSYAANNFFEPKVSLESTAKAKIPNFNLKISNLYQGFNLKVSECINYNLDVVVLDLGFPNSFISVLNKQEIEYPLINQTDCIAYPLDIYRDEEQKKDHKPEFNHPIVDIYPDDIKDEMIYELPQDGVEGDDKLENNRKKEIKKNIEKVNEFIKKKEHLYKLQKVKELIKKLDNISHKSQVYVKELEHKKQIAHGHNDSINLQIFRHNKDYQKINFKQQKIVEDVKVASAALVLLQDKRKVFDIKIKSKPINRLQEKFEAKYPIVVYQGAEKGSEEVSYTMANEYCELRDVKNEVALISKILDSDLTKELLQQKDLNIKIKYPIVLYNKSNDVVGDFEQCLINHRGDLNYTTALIPYEYQIDENLICLAFSQFSLAQILGIKLKEYKMCRSEDKSDDENKKITGYVDHFFNKAFEKDNNNDSGSDYPDLPGGGWWPGIFIYKPINKSENLEFNPTKKHIYTMFLANLGLNTLRLPFFQDLINDLSENINSLEEAKSILSTLSFDTLVEYYYAVQPKNTFTSLLNFLNMDAFIRHNEDEEENQYQTPRKSNKGCNRKMSWAPERDGNYDISTNCDTVRSDKFSGSGSENGENTALLSLKDSIENDDFHPNESFKYSFKNNIDRVKTIKITVI